MQVKFMHVADVHLGYKQYGSETRFEDFSRAFDRAIEKALEAQVDFVLLCGDLFHKSSIDPPTLLQAVSCLDRLRAAEIPVVAVTGNHDRARYRVPRRRSWLDYLAERDHLILLAPSFEDDGTNFTPWDGNQGGYVDLKGVRILGLPYLGSTLDTILEELPNSLTKLDSTGVDYTILLGHFGLEGVVPGTVGGLSYNAITPLREHVDYLALGHLHKPYEREGWVFNPGSLEFCGIDEREWAGGVYLVTVETTKHPKHTVQHVPIPRRPFYRWYFDVTTHNTPEALYEALTAFLKEKKRKHPTQDLNPVVELSLEGVLAFDRATLDAGRVQEILKEIAAPLIPRLRNNTRSTEFEIDTDDHRSRQELEREVILDLVRRDGRYHGRADFWAALIQEIKSLTLSNRPPDEIVTTLRRRMADEG